MKIRLLNHFFVALSTDTFKELDTDGSGEIELDLMKVMFPFWQ